MTMMGAAQAAANECGVVFKTITKQIHASFDNDQTFWLIRYGHETRGDFQIRFSVSNNHGDTAAPYMAEVIEKEIKTLLGK